MFDSSQDNFRSPEERVVSQGPALPGTRRRLPRSRAAGRSAGSARRLSPCPHVPSVLPQRQEYEVQGSALLLFLALPKPLKTRFQGLGSLLAARCSALGYNNSLFPQHFPFEHLDVGSKQGLGADSITLQLQRSELGAPSVPTAPG